MRQPTPEQVLDNWRAYELPFNEQPTLIKSFVSVGGNQSFLIAADDHRWVVRINTGANELGVDRERERVIHEQVAAQGLAPMIKYFSPRGEILITRYVIGENFSPAKIDAELLDALISGVRRFQQIGLDLPSFDYRQHLRLLDPEQASSSELEDAIGLLEARGARALCHHDLIPENIVITHSGPIFIDWEYAAVGIDVMDFAALICDCQIPLEQIAARLGVRQNVLEAACFVYRTMCAKWSLKNAG